MKGMKYGGKYPQPPISPTDTNLRIYSQMRKVREYFLSADGTMLDCSLATGILRANICRYIPHLLDGGLIAKKRKGIDRTTKCGAWYYGRKEDSDEV